jgi:hypothetical protein
MYNGHYVIQGKGNYGAAFGFFAAHLEDTVENTPVIDLRKNVYWKVS